LTHTFPKSIRKYFKFKYGTTHKRTRRLTKRQERAFHTRAFANRHGYEDVVPHEHKYIDTRTGKVVYEKYGSHKSGSLRKGKL
jgi:hypothetical protein